MSNAESDEERQRLDAIHDILNEYDGEEALKRIREVLYDPKWEEALKRVHNKLFGEPEKTDE